MSELEDRVYPNGLDICGLREKRVRLLFSMKGPQTGDDLEESPQFLQNLVEDDDRGIGHSGSEGDSVPLLGGHLASLKEYLPDGMWE